MTKLKKQFEKVLSKYFHKRAEIHDNSWTYKNDCTVAFSHNDYVVCYFELDEERTIIGKFDTTAHNEIHVTTPEDLEREIQKFLKNEKELIKRHRLGLIEAL